MTAKKMKPDLSALHAFPWNEEEDLVFNVHACYGAVSNWGGYNLPWSEMTELQNTGSELS